MNAMNRSKKIYENESTYYQFPAIWKGWYRLRPAIPAKVVWLQPDSAKQTPRRHNQEIGQTAARHRAPERVSDYFAGDASRKDAWATAILDRARGRIAMKKSVLEKMADKKYTLFQGTPVHRTTVIVSFIIVFGGLALAIAAIAYFLNWLTSGMIWRISHRALHGTAGELRAEVGM
jgi:hypothetical protein